MHGTAVGLNGRGCLILGASGSGKSSLAAELIAFGAVLVADDRVVLSHDADGSLRMTAPGAIAGRLEIRGTGLLRLPHAPAPASFAVDLDRTHGRERLPRPAFNCLLGVRVPLCTLPDGARRGPACLLLLRHGLPDDPEDGM